MTGFFTRKIFPSFTKQVAQPQKENTDMDRFEKALRYCLENEDGVRWDHDTGEYTDDPRDPGGATKWGVVLDEYQRFFGGDWTPEMVQAATRDQAIQVYQKYFWAPIKGASYLEDSSAIAIFDTAVNKGLGGAKRILNDAFGTTFTGELWEFNQDILGAVNSLHGQDFLVKMTSATKRYIDQRISDYPNMAWARNGWTNRANRLSQILAWSPQ